MKKVWFIFAGILVFSLHQKAANAQATPRQKSHLAIEKTHAVIIQAKAVVGRGRIYLGSNLSKAVNHQNYAVQLHRSGQFNRAIHQTRYARNCAMEAIKANRAKIAAGMMNDNLIITDVSPTKEVLEEEVTTNLKDPVPDDKAAVTATVVELKPNE